METLTKLKEPELFLGVARILGVRFLDPTKVCTDGKMVVRPAEDLIEDVVVNYELANRKRKRELDRILKDAIREEKDDMNEPTHAAGHSF